MVICAQNMGMSPWERRRRRVADSLGVGNLADHASAVGGMGEDALERQLVLPVADIDPFEGNPRRMANPRYEEIKASIRATGLRVPLTVTRRPGAAKFIVEAGGNTRLRALQDLAEETREQRFAEVTVLYRPWRSEIHVLASHLLENELRGEMCFWDRACGIASLKRTLEAERGADLSLRQLAEELQSRGLARDHVTLAHDMFATERLGALGDVYPVLTGADVRTIQPRLNALRRYAELAGGITESELYERVLDPAVREFAEAVRQGAMFSACAVCDACEAALADRMGLTVSELLRGLVRSTQKRARPSRAGGTAAIEAPDSAALPVNSDPLSAAASSVTRRSLAEQARNLACAAGAHDFVVDDPSTALGFRFRSDLPSDSMPALGNTGVAAMLNYVATYLGGYSSNRHSEIAEAGDGTTDCSPSTLTGIDAGELLATLLDTSSSTGEDVLRFLTCARKALAAVYTSVPAIEGDEVKS